MNTTDFALPPTPSATPIPTPTIPATDPSFDFIPLPKVTTCDICNITWIVSNPELVNLTSVGINLDVAGISDDLTLSDTTIATYVPVLSAHFKWNPVNVRPGQYEIYGLWSDKHGDAVRSQVFEVKTGNTTACLTNPTGIYSESPTSSSNRKSNSDSVVAIVLGLLISAIGFVIIAAIVVEPLRNFFRHRRGDRPSPPASDASTSRDVGVGTHHPAHPADDSAEDHPGNSSNNVASAFPQSTPVLIRIPPHTHTPLDSELSAPRDVGAGTLPQRASTTTLSHNVAPASAWPTPLLTRIPPHAHTPPYSRTSASRDVGVGTLPPTASTTTLCPGTNNVASARAPPLLTPIPLPTSSSDRAGTGLHARKSD